MPLIARLIAGAFALLLALPASAQPGPAEARAHWLRRDLIAWAAPVSGAPSLLAGPDRREHRLERAGVVDGELARAHPHLKGMPLFRVPGADRATVARWLKGAVRVAAGRGTATGLQIGGVLDDLFASDAELGVRFANGVPTVRLWAPTATAVRLHLFDGPRGGQARVLPMREDPAMGVWSLPGAPDWNRHYYLFEVSVFVPAEGRTVTSLVTDPYSLSLARDSERSQIVDLDDPDLKPAGWDALRTPLPQEPEDRALYELHVRDFSVADRSVPARHRGKYLAFTERNAAGMRHLRSLAEAGLSDVHLLPTYDCATVPEDSRTQASPPDLAGLPPAGEAQQAAIMKVRDRDAYNWCYDPYHYLAAEGSYATEPDGIARIVEFRRMVMGLRAAGLGTILDVVFNHTTASGLAPRSVLDRIVPGYYHRLDEAGAVARSTCCANTASERLMMEKLMLDALEVWARDYKVSGFRFDLMGHHSRSNILKARDRLRRLTLAADGVDGARLYLYGEGWNFGEVANDARFVQATQTRMAGTGVGTFNDRLRDAVRGGGAMDSGARIGEAQGFASGLSTAPNASDRDVAADRQALLTLSDHVRAGLAGNLADYAFVTADGTTRRAGELRYGNGPLGYASDPQESVNYVEAHDNETLFDIFAHKLPRDTPAAERVRWQNLAASVVLLAQGVPFLHAGQELLRSKSLDRNSHDSGDWFNLLDFTRATNGWGRGLPPEPDNRANWPAARALLADPRLRVGRAEIDAAAAHVREMLAIRRASPALRLRTAADVIARLRFRNTGPSQVPGVIAMSIDGPDATELVVMINATRSDQRLALPVSGRYALHPVQRRSRDRTVRRATHDPDGFRVPALTTAVFVQRKSPPTR